MTGRPSCAGAEPDLFDYRDGEHAEPVPERFHHAAHTYCRNCPIFEACDTRATENRETGLLAGKIRYWKHRKKRSRKYEIIDLLEEG